MRTDVNFINPYDAGEANVFVRAEHLARYLFAAQFARKRRVRRALDCACGNGYGCAILAREVSAVDGVDRSEELLTDYINVPEPPHGGRVALHPLDLDSEPLPFEDGAFDLAACFETLEHVQFDRELLGELHRVVRRGGWLLLSVPKAGYEPVDEQGRPRNRCHWRLYELPTLQVLLSSHGFVVEQTLGQPYANVSRANMESYRRDSGVTAAQLESWFSPDTQAMECYAHLWAWPTDEAPEHSNGLFLVCRRK
jgi:SAM-dependent methyltransferase